jgi:hypothetical protein
MSSPIQESVGVIVHALDVNIVAVEDGWISFLVAPINIFSGY